MSPKEAYWIIWAVTFAIALLPRVYLLMMRESIWGTERWPFWDRFANRCSVIGLTLLLLNFLWYLIYIISK